jgi:hypothetical protein
MIMFHHEPTAVSSWRVNTDDSLMKRLTDHHEAGGGKDEAVLGLAWGNPLQ